MLDVVDERCFGELVLGLLLVLLLVAHAIGELFGRHDKGAFFERAGLVVIPRVGLLVVGATLEMLVLLESSAVLLWVVWVELAISSLKSLNLNSGFLICLLIFGVEWRDV